MYEHNISNINDANDDDDEPEHEDDKHVEDDDDDDDGSFAQTQVPRIWLLLPYLFHWLHYSL